MNDEDKLSRLYQQSRTDEPPMKLDSVVLSHARRAVARKPFRLSRWLAPMAAVATVMLTASLIIVMKSEHPEVMETNAVMERAAEPLPVVKEARPATIEPLMRHDQAAPARSFAIPVEAPASQRKMMLKAPPAPAMNDAEGIASGALAEAPAAAKKKNVALSPEALLAEIRELHEQGRETEATERMKQFRLQYPDYQIPADFPIK